MCRIPGGRIVATTFTVVMTYLSATLSVARPITTGVILAIRESHPVKLRTSQHVVLIGVIATPVNRFTRLTGTVFFTQFVVGAV